VSDSHGTQGGDEGGESRGRVDLVSLLYILGGIPAIVLYIVISFVLARFLNFPA
jgi:hypothetical protein